MEITRQKAAGVEVVTISGRVSGGEVPRLTEEFQTIRAAASPTDYTCPDERRVRASC